MSNSFSQFWKGNLIPVKILHPYSTSWEITPLHFLAQTIYTFAQKERIKMKIFEPFKCSDQNLSNSSCQLCNEKSIPLQILHRSSLPWQITPLWILNSHFFNFGLKDPIKIPILRLSSALVKCAIFLMSFSKSQVIWK